MILPTIHSNGTSPEMLRRGYSEARLAVCAARRALEAIEFNARDYYPQGPGAWTQASAEHAERYSALLKIATQLDKIEMYCQDAIDAREAQKR